VEADLVGTEGVEDTRSNVTTPVMRLCLTKTGVSIMEASAMQ